MDSKPTFQIADIIKDKHENYYLVLDIVGDRMTIQSIVIEQQPFEVSANLARNIATKVA